MLKLEDITKDCQINGIIPNEIVKIINTDFIGDNAINLIYENQQGVLGKITLFRSDEGNISLAVAGRAWSFDANGEDFKLTLEAQRIRLAHLFDPMLAVHTSDVEPLPHQITAVYEAMLPRQPLRFVLADDPGSGKTIMAGLLISELMIRGDARRIMVVAPGSLVGQWQDELYEKFNLNFEVFSKVTDESSRSGNPFDEHDFLIIRLDQLARSDMYQEKISVATDWDLIIIDESHKMAASFFGGEIKETRRFKLGKILGNKTRHFLMMTATPHNGKEEDFQLFLSLLDGDRFYGKFRDGAPKLDVSDIMRRMIKEELLRFDGTPLFPERIAYTPMYELSPLELALYERVTNYVRNEMNRADNLDDKRKGTIGFALTILQRRLASSPEAIYQSLCRRRKRLEKKLEELIIIQKGGKYAESFWENTGLDYADIDLNEASDELPNEENELLEDTIVDQATASRTRQELESEIEILKDLESKALEVKLSGQDRKWDELSELFQNDPNLCLTDGRRRKLIVFTEHRDTLNYLKDRIETLLGRQGAVLEIHGSIGRDNRKKIQDLFWNDKDATVLLATDAAGEGLNFQCAHLMVNYDLPWNPNRIEQRFGRIHRIGQKEVCHLWNLVAAGTREGEVFKRLFDKLEAEKKALGGRVFNILGEAFENRSLKEMLLDAIRYGEQPDVQARLFQQVDGALDHDHLNTLINRHALIEQHMSQEAVYAIREEMEKAEARKLQPYFIRAFFQQAFSMLNGSLKPREANRFEISHVPTAIRDRDRLIGSTRKTIVPRYERICFEKQYIHVFQKPMAEMVHPGHPLMAAMIDLILEANRAKLKQGTILVDPTDMGIEPKILFVIDHTIREAQMDHPKDISRRLQFVLMTQQGNAENAGWAPHLDYRAINESEQQLISDILNGNWIKSDLERCALEFAIQTLVPNHYEEIHNRVENQVSRTLDAVHERLIKEIRYLDDRYVKLQEDVRAGKQPRMQPENVKRTMNELQARLENRTKELNNRRHVISQPPVILGGALIIPQGLLELRLGNTQFSKDADLRKHIEKMAIKTVFEYEISIGYNVTDVSDQNCGWDITSRAPQGSNLTDRHIEVKGRAKGQPTITISRNEIMYALNQSDKFLLAIVIIDEQGQVDGPYYIPKPFDKEPDWGVASINYELASLLKKATISEG